MFSEDCELSILVHAYSGAVALAHSQDWTGDCLAVAEEITRKHIVQCVHSRRLALSSSTQLKSTFTTSCEPTCTLLGHKLVNSYSGKIRQLTCDTGA